MAPLTKRIPRQLAHNWTKYVALFVMIVLFVGVVSGYGAAISSSMAVMSKSYDKLQVEDGEFTTNFKVSDSILDEMESKGTKIYENFNVKTTTTDAVKEESTLRVFKIHKDVNMQTYVEGAQPASATDIAIDRNFAENNNIKVGDTITVRGKKLTVCGLNAFGNYQYQLETNSSFMGNTQTYSLCTMTDAGYDWLLGEVGAEEFTYAFKMNDRSLDYEEREDIEDEMMDVLTDNKVAVTMFLDRDNVTSISYASDDMEGDWTIVLVLGMIIFAVLAFIMSVVTNANIDSESAVIGTLLASGYRRSEIVRHYMAIPTLVSVLGVVFGNVVGYTYFMGFMKDLYYKNYSLPPYEVTFDAEQFLIVSVIPLIILILIALFGILRKFKLTPLQFLRHELKKRKGGSKFHMPERWKFTSRFRMRVFLQNLGKYATLLIGIWLGSSLIVFALLMTPSIHHYANEIAESTPVNHIYTVKVPLELTGDAEEVDAWKAYADLTKNVDLSQVDEDELETKITDYFTEKMQMPTEDALDDLTAEDLGLSKNYLGGYSVGEFMDLLDDMDSIDTDDDDVHPVNTLTNSQSVINQAEKLAMASVDVKRRLNDSNEEITIYALQKDSKYWSDLGLNDLSGNEVVVGAGLIQKCAVNLNEEFEAKTTTESYKLTPVATYGYDSNENIYMTIEQFNKIFDHDPNYFNGYASDEALNLDPTYVLSETTPAVMQTVANELDRLMGEMVWMLVVIAVMIYFITMYLLTKVIIDNSARSISYMKVFGYRQREISGLYVRSITITVVVSLVVTLPIVLFMINQFWVIALSDYGGNIVMYFDPTTIVGGLVFGLVTYAIVALLDIRHINSVSMAEALKVQE